MAQHDVHRVLKKHIKVALTDLAVHKDGVQIHHRSPRDDEPRGLEQGKIHVRHPATLGSEAGSRLERVSTSEIAGGRKLFEDVEFAQKDFKEWLREQDSSWESYAEALTEGDESATLKIVRYIDEEDLEEMGVSDDDRTKLWSAILDVRHKLPDS